MALLSSLVEMTCPRCGEAVYVHMYERHLAKDHDPFIEEEDAMVSACVGQGLTLDQVFELTDDCQRDRVFNVQNDPCDEPVAYVVRGSCLVSLIDVRLSLS